MENDGLKQVSLDEMSQEMKDDADFYWKIFDRGVKAAKAENERLGIVVNEEVEYDQPVESSPKVAESENG